VSGCPKCWGICGYSVRCICNYLFRLSVIYWVTFTVLSWSCICNLKDMFLVAFVDVQHPSSHQSCGYVQDAVALSNDDCPLWRCLYALGVDALACTVRSWMKLTLTSLCSLNEYTIDILDWLCLLCARILISWPSLPVWKWISTLLQKFKVNTKLLLWSSVCNPIDMFLNALLRSQSVISLKCSDMWYGWCSRDRAGESWADGSR
jgi:hypothetical protein